MTAPETPPLTFLYRNHRGEVAQRRVWPNSLYYGSSGWHPEPQWFLHAVDLDRDAVRVFAFRDIIALPETPDEAWIEAMAREIGVAIPADTLDDVQLVDVAAAAYAALARQWGGGNAE